MQIAGKYGKAVVHSRNLDGKCAEEIRNICDMPFTGRWNMQVMPDQHYVSDYCVNGLTTDFGDTLMPEMLGFDMGCGMLVMKLKEREADLDKLHLSVLRSVPFAPMSRHTPNQKALALPWNELIVQGMPDIETSCRYVGVMFSGGNHFIELDRGEDECLYLVIHAGCVWASTHIMNGYSRIACEKAGVKYAPGKEYLEKARCTISGQDLEEFIHDVEIAEKIAICSREIMGEEICGRMGFHVIDSFHTIHNTISAEERILRKGAVSAKKGEILYIPMNMAEGGYICRGKGNPEWNFSAPHGAGRRMSASSAEKEISMDDFREVIKNVYVPYAGSHPLREAPQAFKPSGEILEAIEPTVEIIQKLMPIYNIKTAY